MSVSLVLLLLLLPRRNREAILRLSRTYHAAWIQQVKRVLRGPQARYALNTGVEKAKVALVSRSMLVPCTQRYRRERVHKR